MIKRIHRVCCALAMTALAACATPPAAPPTKQHLTVDDLPAAASIPAPVQQTLALAKPKAVPKTETYSVIVNNVKVHDLLFALARDAKLNVDIHPGIAGNVTLNAIDQTLPQLLNRIGRQADIRWELDGPNLSVMPDSPYLNNYKVDYVNMSREMLGSVSVASQINAGVPGATGGGTGSSANNSATRIENSARNRFWETLVGNIKDILRETDKVLPDGSSETVTEHLNQQQTTGTGVSPPASGNQRAAQAQTGIAASPIPAALQSSAATVTRRSTFREAASVIANPEAGLISVRATSRQHRKVQEFLDQVMSSAKRQVLIEATIAEVQLKQDYLQGIDWSRVRGDANATGLRPSQDGRSISHTDTAVGSAAGLFTLGARHVGSTGALFTATLRLLETFGTVKVLSSPKISVLNNQSAILKVVDNQVYFTVKVETNQNANNTTTNVTTTPYTVPVGFVMNVTPQISENDTILLNLRPSVSRVVGEKLDPNPQLTIENRIPVIRTREMESVMRVENGNVAVLGGLMEDSLNNVDSGVPGASAIPGLGALFTQRNDRSEKSELVVFLRPVVIREASLAGDFRGLRDLLPNKEFFANNPGPRTQLLPSSEGGRP